MKKLLLIAAIAIVNYSMNIFAQSDDPDKYYIRNSVYMMKLGVPSDTSYADATAIMDATFDTIHFAANYERYNDFSLDNRIIDFDQTPTATKEEIEAIGKNTLLEDYINKALVEKGLKTSNISEYEYAARLLKFFEKEKTANKLVAKWYNKPGTPEGEVDFDNDLYTISEFGLRGLSQEAKENARATENLENLTKSAADKLLTNSYVCVNRYGYMSAEEALVYATAIAEFGIQRLPAIAQVAARAGLKLLGAKIKGYFVRANAYLFQLDWNEDLKNKLYGQYWNNPAGFMDDTNYKLKYVGKSSKRAPAALSLKKSTNEEALIARATVRGTDAAFAALQRDHENFRPMCALHEIDGKLAAYIGKKEDIKSGDKFDVFEMVKDKNGIAEWNKVGTIKVKGGVWDNRAGAGIDIEGASTDDEGKDKAASTPYTAFDAKPSKSMHEGCMIRLTK